MSQKFSAPAARPHDVTAQPSVEQAVRDICRATRKHHSAEDKIRIVLEGLRGEDSIAALCRREGIAESLYYSWPKDFLEAGKRRLAGDIALADTAQSPRHRPLTSTKLRRLSDAMCQGLREGPTELHRAYIRMFVSRIVVSAREVHISGPRAALAKAASDDVYDPGRLVPSFVRKWRPVCDETGNWETIVSMPGSGHLP